MKELDFNDDTYLIELVRKISRLEREVRIDPISDGYNGHNIDFSTVDGDSDGGYGYGV